MKITNCKMINRREMIAVQEGTILEKTIIQSCSITIYKTTIAIYKTTIADNNTTTSIETNIGKQTTITRLLTINIINNITISGETIMARETTNIVSSATTSGKIGDAKLPTVTVNSINTGYTKAAEVLTTSTDIHIKFE